ncbi:MAG: D-glycero-beta-D-manno-heptose-7-phosphate kinase [Nitrospiraceae bacterium]|nr:D-glycero-beta-D-manno-heptose-7-phosphate kinase [Nitrospiraceae bacterium]
MKTTADMRRLTRVISRFPKTRVLVVGDVMIDHYVWGTVSRISPEAPVPVVNVTRESMLLGAAANVVNNIRSLGGDVSICGVIGQDDAGRRLQHLLREQSIPTDGLITEPGRPTTIKTRVIAHHQQVVRFDREEKKGIGKETHRRILDHVVGKAETGLDAIVISDYSKGVVTRELVRDIVRLARKRGIIVSVDPKVNHFGIYSGVTILTPNTKEASLGSKIEIEDDASLLRAGTTLLRRLACSAVLVTRGEQGMSLFEKRGKVTHIPTVAREVFDVTGAGDTVISTLTLAMAAGARTVDAAKLSNFAAGIVVGVVGTACVTPQQLIQQIHDHGVSGI